MMRIRLNLFTDVFLFLAVFWSAPSGGQLTEKQPFLTHRFPVWDQKDQDGGGDRRLIYRGGPALTFTATAVPSNSSALWTCARLAAAKGS
ncbi:hypothetical protein EYF80_058820 [Liparis tanakae]|uniref:Secreted protein n=1 Tax=Liparis tanakae TaxID=230148 RepID=A0A4Z2EQB9_9TELE|nr:hypothetical protein EYF80_058820 [Liparis tanakae]